MSSPTCCVLSSGPPCACACVRAGVGEQGSVCASEVPFDAEACGQPAVALQLTSE